MGNKPCDIERNSTFILCQFCYNKVPLIELFIENNKAKIKLKCTCEESQLHSIYTMNLSDYLKKIHHRDPILFKCNIHEDKEAITFCCNCEKRLCEECIKTGVHKDETCKRSQNESNSRMPECIYHSKMSMEYFCKKCKCLFCEKCAKKHTSFVSEYKNVNENEKGFEHKMLHVPTYLTDQRMEKKKSKLNSFKEYVMKINEEVTHELINSFNPIIKEEGSSSNTTDDNNDTNDTNNNSSSNNNEQIKEIKTYEILTEKNSKEYKTQKLIEKTYETYKEENNELIDFIELMFLNISQQIIKPITNPKVFLNFIKNTSFITNNFEYPSDIDINNNEDKAQCLMHYLKTNFLFKTLSYQMNYYKTLKTSNETVLLLYYLGNNKFVSAGDTLMQLWNGSTCSKLANLTGHTNSIQSICKINDDQFASASSDKTIRIWSIEKKECISILNISGIPSFIFANKHNIDEVGFLIFGKKIEMFNITTSKTVRQYEFDKSSWYDTFYQFTNGNILLGTYSGFIIVDGQTMQKKHEVTKLENEPNVYLELGDDKLIVGMKNYNNLMLFENGYKVRKKFISNHNALITGIIHVKDDLIMTSSMDFTIKLWNVNNMECIETFHVATGEINGIIKLDNGIVVGSLNNSNIIAWNYEKYDEV